MGVLGGEVGVEEEDEEEEEEKRTGMVCVDPD